MLRLRDAAIHAPSPNADKHYQRLRMWNLIVAGFVAAMVLCGIWNVFTLATVTRRTAPDLADIDHLLRHPSSIAVFLFSIITIGAFAFKEWRYGDRGLVMVYTLALWLFLTLVPVMTAETRPAMEELTLEARYLECKPGSITGGRHLDASSCRSVSLTEGQIRLAHANPADGDTRLYAPDTHGSGVSKWSVNGRGVFTVYVLIDQESVDVCKATPFRASIEGRLSDTFDCVEIDGAAWLVVPMQTSAPQPGWIAMYQEFTPEP